MYVFDLGSDQLIQHIYLIRVSNDFEKGVRHEMLSIIIYKGN